jgi:phosphoribosylformylglycinamidine synthase
MNLIPSIAAQDLVRVISILTFYSYFSRLDGDEGNFWAPDYSTGSWRLTKEIVQPLIKVETHNHPTAISPFPGAATGSGGEIRDEGAVGRGSTPKAGLCGFWVSDLLIPGRKRAWESDVGKPIHYASSLDIMLEAPIGSARFNNEFGRPSLTGTFRTLLTNAGEPTKTEYRGYHKPIMVCLPSPDILASWVRIMH